MKTKIIEVTSPSKFNFGKFLIGDLGELWPVISEVDAPRPVMRVCGWSKFHLLIVDLQTGEGFIRRMGGIPSADLNKHKVWVCPMYEPFLCWLDQQDLSDIEKLPSHVELPQELAGPHEAMSGFRRGGPTCINDIINLFTDRFVFQKQQEAKA